VKDFSKVDIMDEELNQETEELRQRRSQKERILKKREIKKKFKSKLVSFNLEEDIVDALNNMSEQKGINKSKFVRMLLREKLEEIGELKRQ
jgi:predicted DNA binding CopG/RHH family protein